MDLLSEDLVIYLLDKLDNTFDVLALSSVNKSLRDIITRTWGFRHQYTVRMNFFVMIEDMVRGWNVRDLHFYGITMGTSVVEALQQCAHLTSVQFTHVTMMGGVLAKLLTEHTTIRKLEFAQHAGFDNVDVVAMCANKELHTIIFENMHIPSDQLCTVIGTSRNLMHLDFFRCEPLKSTALAHITTALCKQHMKRISITASNTITDDVLTMFATSCPNLTYIDFSNCAVITDAGACAFEQCTNLAYADFLGCSGVGPATYAALTTRSVMQSFQLGSSDGRGKVFGDDAVRILANTNLKSVYLHVTACSMNEADILRAKLRALTENTWTHMYSIYYCNKHECSRCSAPRHKECYLCVSRTPHKCLFDCI